MSDSQSSSRNDEHSVTRWIAFLKSGDQSAAQELWIRYVTRLVRLARARIGSVPRRLADENDAANSVFHDLLIGIEQNRFPDLQDRQDLWQILVMLTEREAVSLRRKELASKRGGWRVFRESELADTDSLQGRAMEQVVGGEPTAEFSALCAEQLTERLATLSFDPVLSQIAQAKLSGYSNSEIAQRLSLSLRTVERNLAFIRKLWTPEALK